MIVVCIKIKMPDLYADFICNHYFNCVIKVIFLLYFYSEVGLTIKTDVFFFYEVEQVQDVS